ncbi:hypothetical protein MMC28_000751 [Mycoblastus sanguinarius]|nr:hypothetical protein [Mycoblastus sanguinarius]
MYSTPLPASTSMNGMGGGLIDGSGTINPAALNTPVSVLPNASSINAQISPRGQKRSRSPEHSAEPLGGGPEDDDQKPKKRGRPTKSKGLGESPTSSTSQQITQNSPDQLRTPQLPSQGLPQDGNNVPHQTSPPKSTPTKPVLKALPTVRDHTTDQLTYEGDEYVPREYDEAGEKKVSPTGQPLGGREFKIRIFLVAHRGEKLFMLATECARVLGYRDSYLLFNKNRSLHKIIATQQEKDELIHQEILPYSYRSRQIAIVTAKSMFRQFGARVIADGRRVRDDYWEAKAIKQGFTEEDMAGDKRPGAAKARDIAAAQEAAQADPVLGHRPNIIYNNTNMESPHGPPDLPPELRGSLPMIDDSRLPAYGTIPRPRQEITGAPYQDRTQTSPPNDVLHQSSNAVDHSKTINQQRMFRNKHMDDIWNKKRESPVSTPQQKVEQSPPVTNSPHLPSSSMIHNSQQSMLQHQASQMMSPQQDYSHHQSHQQNPSQSPVRGMPSSIRPELPHQRSSISYPPGHVPQTSPYGYPHPQSQMWGQPPPHPQPQQSPIPSHHPGLPQYSPSPHPQHPTQPQHHLSQSPHPQHPSQHPPPQLHHSQSSGSMHSGINYQTMAGMPGGPSGYSGASAMQAGRAMYSPQSGSPSQQQYMQQQTTAAQQAGMQGWAPPPQQQGQSGWQNYPTSTGY